MKQHWLIVTAAAALTLGISLVATAHAGELRAGAARVSITPTADEFPYTVGREKSFVGVHDEVYARALVLDDGVTRVAIVVAEVEAVPDPKRVVTEVAQAVGVPESHVMVTASHTHESLTVFIHGGDLIPAQVKEMEHVRLGTVEAARQAVAHLQPARIAFGRSEAFVNINDGELSGLGKGVDPKGPSDKTLDVVRVESTDGQPIALLVNYATHAQVMFRSVSKDGGYEVSGDIPGAVSRIMEDNPAGAPVVLYMAAAEGDQKPIFESLQPAAGNMPAADEGAAGWGLLNVLARRVATSAFDALDGMAAGISDVVLQSAAGTATCPGGHIRVDSQTHEITQEDRPLVNIPLQTIRLGDIAFAAVGGDVGTKIGQEIRTASPEKNTIIVSQLAGAIGYILPDESYLHPGHGISGSPLKSGCAEHAIPGGIAGLLGSQKN
jgi:hypothetical protein